MITSLFAVFCVVGASKGEHQIGSGEENEMVKRKRNEDGLQTTGKAAKTHEELDTEEDIPTRPAMDVNMQADFIAAQAKAAMPLLSNLELEDYLVAPRSLVDTIRWNDEDNIGDGARFIRVFCNDKQQTVDGKGPRIIFIAAAALRVAELTRNLRQLRRKDYEIGKFFARHVKLQAAIDQAKRIRVGIAVGTPQRLADLVQADALRVENLEYVVLDSSHRDAKEKTIWDIKESRDSIFNLFHLPRIRNKIKEEGSKVILM